jgi:hypothetical protein
MKTKDSVGVARLISVHDTDDGLIVSVVTQLGDRKWSARHFGPQLEGGRITKTFRQALTYLTESFEQMFPEHHPCNDNCQTAVERLGYLNR